MSSMRGLRRSSNRRTWKRLALIIVQWRVVVLNVTFCRNMYLYTRPTPIEFQDHMSIIMVTGPDFRIFHYCEIGQKKFVRTITHKPLHLARWSFAWTCTLTIARTLLIFENYTSQVVVTGPDFRIFYYCEMGKKFVYTITHQPLHSAWWYFARTCT